MQDIQHNIADLWEECMIKKKKLCMVEHSNFNPLKANVDDKDQGKFRIKRFMESGHRKFEEKGSLSCVCMHMFLQFASALSF